MAIFKSYCITSTIKTYMARFCFTAILMIAIPFYLIASPSFKDEPILAKGYYIVVAAFLPTQVEEAKKYYPNSPEVMKKVFEATFGVGHFVTNIMDRVKTFEDALEMYIKSNVLEPIEIQLLAYNGSNKEILADHILA